jgi:zinc transport system ATP-binding protein
VVPQSQMATRMLQHSEKLAEVNEAGVRRDGRWLVENISLSIARGEILTLIGPNGSGKTTTAKLVTGVTRPDAGSVWRKPGLRVGYVPQKLAIDWTLPLTVKRLMSLTASHKRGEVDAALDRVGIAHLAQAEVQNLSGGEFQRALLARAMLRKPDLLVLDEPVQGVDFSGEVALYDLIGQIRDETGCGILMISHDLHVVMAATDTVICLNGHVCCRGAPEQVARSPEYLSLFGARAASALALYQHHHDHTHLPDGRVLEADGKIVSAHEHAHDEHGHDHHGHAHGASAREADHA